MTWDGESYQREFDRLAESGRDMHGEADFVMRFDPGSVLDAGCGTGRVAIELARRGVDVVGVDLDPSMLATARQRAPHLEWVEHDLATLDLGSSFDVVLMAGNVLLFTEPGTEAAVVAACADHVAHDGVLVAGFSTDRHYRLGAFDADCEAAGLSLRARYATWSGDPFEDGGDYAVSVFAAD